MYRKLKELDYLTNYSHRGGFYTFGEIARFDANGLWSHDQAWFSRHGTLLATAEAFVTQSPRGYLADELAQLLHVEVQDCLRQLANSSASPANSSPASTSTLLPMRLSADGNYLLGATFRPSRFLPTPRGSKYRRKK